MKAVLYVILQSVITGGEERKTIQGIYTVKNQAQNRMNEIVVEFENKQNDEGNFLWECERPCWNIANFKGTVRELTMRFEVVKREFGI